jgi:H/ACA ribonucleoprotein complex subunit 4
MKYGTPPREREIDEYIRKGVINLDKPPGPTSYEVVRWIKDILGIKKAGHLGTLDPNVSGVLPVLLDKSTKLAGILEMKKEYICLAKLHSEISDTKLRNITREWTGKIYQRPPLKSAVKQKVRIREIYSLDVIERDRRDILLRIGCEAGTYVRKLIHDMGEALGCGAHMVQLRRIAAGPFREENSVRLHQIKDAYEIWKEEEREDEIRKLILPMEDALVDLPHILIRDSAVDAICHGADLAAPGFAGIDPSRRINSGEKVVMITRKNEAVAVGEAKVSSVDMLHLSSGIFVKTTAVFMEPGTYPKGWR